MIDYNNLFWANVYTKLAALALLHVKGNLRHIKPHIPTSFDLVNSVADTLDIELLIHLIEKNEKSASKYYKSVH
jgi:bifunctional DNase/RNase